jgi:hypothetical protein
MSLDCAAADSDGMGAAAEAPAVWMLAPARAPRRPSRRRRSRRDHRKKATPQHRAPRAGPTAVPFRPVGEHTPGRLRARPTSMRPLGTPCRGWLGGWSTVLGARWHQTAADSRTPSRQTQAAHTLSTGIGVIAFGERGAMRYSYYPPLASILAAMSEQPALIFFLDLFRCMVPGGLPVRTSVSRYVASQQRPQRFCSLM